MRLDFTEHEKRLLLLLPDVLVPALITGNLLTWGVPVCLALVVFYRWLLGVQKVSAPHGDMRGVHMAVMRFVYILPITAMALGHHYMFGTRFVLLSILVMIGGLAQSIHSDSYPLANTVLVQAFVLRDRGDDQWIFLLPFSLALCFYHRYAIKL